MGEIIYFVIKNSHIDINHSFYRKLIVEGDPYHIGKMKFLKSSQEFVKYAKILTLLYIDVFSTEIILILKKLPKKF